MPLYGGIDLHANNSVVVLLNEQDQVIYQKRLPNHLPTIVRGRVLWHLGYSHAKRAAAFTESSGAYQRAALQQEPSYQVRGALGCRKF